MVYKKYVYKKGRKHGPYYYHSYREGDSVKKVYIGGRKEYKEWLKKEERKEPHKTISRTTTLYLPNFHKINKRLLIIPLAILLAVFLGFLIYNQLSLVGKVSLEMQDTYVFGENISGSLRLNLKEGELLPLDSKLVIEQDGAISEIVLSELLQSNNEGNFYIENQEITGMGQGYGFAGTKIIYSTLAFKLKVYDFGEEEPEDEEEVEEVTTEETPIEEANASQAEEQTPQTEETQEQVEQIPSEEIPTEAPQGNSVEQTQEKSESETAENAETSESAPEASESSESGREGGESEGESTDTSSPITGEAVKETEKEKKVDYVDGSVSKDEPFLYTLQEGKTASIKKNSVKDEDNKKLGDDAVTLQISGQEAEVTTDYSISEQGFGSEYMGEEIHYIDISLEGIGILAKNGTLTIKLTYQDINLAEASEEIEVVSEIPVKEDNLTEENVTMPEENITEIENITIINETIINATIINETVLNETTLNITTKQYKAVINNPVKWIKAVKIEDGGNNLTLELPKQAQNITVKTGQEVQEALNELDAYEQLINETDRTSLITGQVTGDVSLELEKSHGILIRFWNWLARLTITGNVISEDEIQQDITETTDSKIIDLTNIAEATQETDIGVEYYTDAPISTEENITDGKRINISAADELNYTNILAFTEIPNGTIKNEDNQSIKVYQYVWVEETAINETQGIIEEKPVIAEQINESQIEPAINESVSEIVNETISTEDVIEQEVINSSGLITSQVIKNKEKGNQVPQWFEHASTDYKKYNTNNYLNVGNKKENKDANSVASMVTQILTDYNNHDDNEYINVSDNKKENKRGKNVTPVVRKFFTDYNNYSNNSYINLSDNKKENATNVASTVTQIFTDYNNFNENKYINVSMYNNSEVAPVALTVMHQSEKLGLHGLPGASPGWGASALLSLVSAQQEIQEAQSQNEQLTSITEESLTKTDNAESSTDNINNISLIENDNVSDSQLSGVSGLRRLTKVPVDFTVYDLDLNGYIDYVEWQVPHLSNQTYEIILITKAEHLDENRTFINNIYEEVKAKDNNWSETINPDEYVRVTFEIPLDNTRDITLYARASNWTNSSNNSNLTECYDNETEILTENGWKLFDKLNGNEKVATLNQETGETEYQKPLEKQVFEHDGEMYKVVLEDGSDLLVSEEHKVYAYLVKNNLTENFASGQNFKDSIKEINIFVIVFVIILFFSFFFKKEDKYISIKDGEKLKEELVKIIKKGESENVEFKSSLSQINEIIQTISAFSNTYGGLIFIGISNSGKILGCEIGKDSIERLTNSISQSIEPKVHPEILTETINYKKIIIINLIEAIDKPVLAFGRLYKRIGKSTILASRNEFEKLVLEKHRDKINFDSQICKEANLKDVDKDKIKRFRELYEDINKSSIKSSDIELLKSLNCLKESDGKIKITNAGILLFGKKPEKFYPMNYITIARYPSIEKGQEYSDIKDFYGSLFEIVDSANSYIKEHIQEISKVVKGKLAREVIPQYSYFAIRELITNAVVHRDYSIKGSRIIIRMFKDRIEFSSPGALPANITPENIIYEQYSRNPIITDVFSKVKYIEEIGEGWDKIIDSIKKHPLKPKLPEIINSGNTVVISLFSPKEMVEKVTENQKQILELIKQNPKITRKELGVKLGEMLGVKLSENNAEIIRKIAENKFITSLELSKHLSLSITAIENNISKLKKIGIIKRVGPDKGGYWKILDGSINESSSDLIKIKSEAYRIKDDNNFDIIRIEFKDGSVLSIDDENWIFALKTKLSDENISFEEFEKIFIKKVIKHWENKTVPTKWPWNWSWEKELEDDIWHKYYDKFEKEKSKEIKRKLGYYVSRFVPVHNFNKIIKEENASLIKEGVALKKKRLIIRNDSEEAKICEEISKKYSEIVKRETKKEFEKRKEEAKNKYKTQAEIAKEVLYHIIRGRLLGILLSKATNGKTGGIVSSDNSISIVKHDSVVTKSMPVEDEEKISSLSDDNEEKGFGFIKKIKNKLIKKKSKEKAGNIKRKNKNAKNNLGIIFVLGILLLSFGVSIVYANENNQNITELAIENFSLYKITDIYSDINNGKEIYFLDSENKPVKIKSITKEPYSGRIYDVDVDNDIVLVRRKNSNGEYGNAVWSGNSNPQPAQSAQIEVYAQNSNDLIATFENIQNEDWYKVFLTALPENQSYDTFDLRIKSNSVEFDYIVDPLISSNNNLTIDKPENNSMLNINESIELNFSADNVDLDSCWYTTDGGLNNFSLSTSAGSCANDTINISDAATTTLILYMNDTSNTETSLEDYIFADTITPNITFDATTTTNASTQSNTDIFVNLSTQDEFGHYAFTDFDNDLVLWMRMDDLNASGDVVDNSSWGNNGTWSSNTTRGQGSDLVANGQRDAGYFGKGFVFDGDGDYVDFPDTQQTIPDGSNFTISAWVYPKASIITARDIFGMSDDGSANFRAYSLSTVTNGFAATVGNSSQTVQANCPDVSLNTWAHIVAVFNGTSVFCYTNGVSSAPVSVSLTGTFPKKKAGSSEVMGAGYEGISGYFNGTIDEVMVFNRSLSADEVAALYNATLNQSQNNYTSLADATHTFTGYVVDKAGNVNQTDENWVTVDTGTPGDVNISYPYNITFDNYITDLNYTTTDTGTLDSCWYSIDDGTTNSSPVVAGVNWTELSGNSSLGSNNWTVYCNDSASNENFTSVTFVVDDVIPNITFDATTTANASTQSNTDVFVNLSTQDEFDHYAFTDFNNDVVLWMRMDDINSSGDVVDLSSYSNNGSKQGNAAQTDAGYYGKGFVFDGNGDYVNAGDSSSLQIINEITVSAWIKPKDDGQNDLGRIMDKGKYLFFLNSIDEFDFYIVSAAGVYQEKTTTSPISPMNEWYHLVATYNSSDMKLYVNGVEQSTSIINNNSGAITTDTTNLYIGDRVAGGRAFNGTIDEVLIFNRSLSDTEILALYNATANQYYNNFTGLSDATHTFTGYAVDRAGNVNQTDENWVTIDATSPGDVNISYPYNITFDNYITDLNYTTTDAGTLDSCWYSIDDGTTNSSPVVAGVNWTDLSGNSTLGSNEWFVYCNDSASNENFTSVIFVVDDIIPNITFDATTTANASTQGNTDVFVNLSTQDEFDHYAFTDFDSSLVGWWRMDDLNASGDVVDNSSWGNNGTWSSNTTRGEGSDSVANGQRDAGYYGKGFVFDGDGDYVNVGSASSLQPTAKITLSAWINPRELKLENIAGNLWVGGYVLRVQAATGTVLFGINDADSLDKYIVSTQTIGEDIWTHVVGIYNGTDLKVYVNGVEKTKTTTQTSIGSSSKTTRIGNLDGSTLWFNGTIDEVLIFNRSLSDTEVLALYNASATQYENNYTGLSDATHTFTGYAVDKAGNVNQTDENWVTVDATTPGDVNISYPYNITFDNYITDLNYTTTDTGTLDSCWYSIDDGTTNSSPVAAGTNWTELSGNSSLGSNEWFVYCNDSASNENFTSVIFVVDDIIPNITFDSTTTANASTQSNTDIFVNLSTQDEFDHYAFADFDNDLVLWMRMDDLNASGDVVDNSSWGNNGTRVNAVQTDAGYYGKGFVFDGDGDYVDLGTPPASLDLLSNYTISVWVYLGGTTGVAQGMVKRGTSSDAGQNQQYSLYITNARNIVFVIGDGSASNNQLTATSTLPIGSWKHLVAVANDTNMSLYIDGVLNKEIARTVTWAGTETLQTIGTLKTTTNYWNGTIDEVIVFNRSLSAGEISALYNASANQYYNNYTDLSDATHTFTGYAVDKAGNVNQTDENWVSVDSVIPILAITYPINTTYATDIALLNYTIDEVSGSCWYSINDGATNSSIETAGTNFSSITSSEGSNNWSVYCNDSASNEITDSIVFIKDTGNSELFIVSPSNTTYAINSIDFNVTSSEHLSDCNFTIDSWTSYPAMNEFNATYYNYTNGTMVDGQYTAQFICNDTAGNLNDTEQVTFLIDTLNPELQISYPSDGQNFSSGLIDVNYTYTELNPDTCWWTNDTDVSNHTLASCETNITGETWDSGTNNVTIYINDSAGNSNSTNVSFDVDLIYPSLTITYPSDGQNFSSGLIDVNYTYTELNPDTCWWTNDTDVSNHTLTNCDTNITGETWDSGTNNVTIYINDTAGNFNSTNVSFDVDATFPLWSNNRTNLTVSTVLGDLVYFNITISESAPDFYVFSWYNGTNWENTTGSYIDGEEISIEKTIRIDIGDINWTWEMNDTAGNLNITDEWNTVLIADDDMPPNVTLDYPVGGGNYSTSSIELNLSVVDNVMIDTCWYTLNTGADNYTMSNTSASEFSATNSSIADGAYTAEFYCNDTNNNLNNTESIAFSIDTTFPTIDYGEGTAVDYENLSQSNIYVNATFTEINFGNITFTLYNDTGIMNSTLFDTETYDINWTELDDNNYTYQVNITDTALNKNATDIRTVLLDIANPSVTLLTPVAGTSTTATETNFTFNAADTNDIDNCSLIVDNIIVVNLSTVSKTAENGIYSGINLGAHNWSINCTDNSGNVGNSTSWELIITSPGGGGDGGGGGGGGSAGGASQPVTTTTKNVAIDISEINLDIIAASTKERLVRVTNNGKQTETIYIGQKNLDKIVTFSEDSFVLSPGQSKEVKISFTPEKTGIYTGKVFISGKQIPVSINANSKELLFDAMIVVPETDKIINIGGKLTAQVTLIPMGEEPRVDVTIHYLIKDFEGKTHAEESETVLVDKQKSFKKEFYTSNLPAGDYVVGLELIYPTGVATSSSHFQIAEESSFSLFIRENLKLIISIMILGAIVLIVSITVIMIRYKKRKKRMLSIAKRLK